MTANWTYDGVDRPASLIVDATPAPGGDETVVSQAGYWPAGPFETLELGNGFEEHRAVEGGPSSVYFFYLAGRPVAELLVEGATATWQFLTVDHLGTPIAGTDTGGALLWQGGLDPFGGAVDSGTPLRLPGQWVDDAWTDASSGLNPYYNVHRWYEPGTGRYTRPDPIGQLLVESGASTLAAAFPSAYAYALQRPTVNVDALGLLTKPGGTGGPETCRYYDDVCRELGCEYHCEIAPRFCKAGTPLNVLDDEGTVRCIRRCLQDEDSGLLEPGPACECQGCPPPREKCLTEPCIVGYHRRCFQRCGSALPFIVPALLFPGQGC